MGLVACSNTLSIESGKILTLDVIVVASTAAVAFFSMQIKTTSIFIYLYVCVFVRPIASRSLFLEIMHLSLYTCFIRYGLHYVPGIYLSNAVQFSTHCSLPFFAVVVSCCMHWILFMHACFQFKF